MGAVFGCAVDQATGWVLAALADHADTVTGRLYVSVGRLMWKTSLSRRSVQTILARLRTRGALVVIGSATGGRGHATEYELHLDALPQKAPYSAAGKGAGDAPLSPGKGAAGCAVSPRKGRSLTSQRAQPDVVKGAAATAPQPYEPIEPRREAPALALVLSVQDLALSDEWATVARGDGCADPSIMMAEFRDHYVGQAMPLDAWCAKWRRWSRNHARFGCPCQDARRGPRRVEPPAPPIPKYVPPAEVADDDADGSGRRSFAEVGALLATVGRRV